MEVKLQYTGNIYDGTVAMMPFIVHLLECEWIEDKGALVSVCYSLYRMGQMTNFF